ncbi:hypothetical protein LP421_12670 [Rhizobium sp. RCAM05350]|nr:hypothetical protein LP421_12670 [Rhizobium sp. RCAM05350]
MIELGTTDFDFWSINTDPASIFRYSQGLKQRYPSRNLVIFAKRGDCDDIACWEEGKPGRIVVINDFADNGYENAGEYDDFQDWFKSVIDTMMKDWN